MSKVIYEIEGNVIVEQYSGVELISTTINGVDEYNYDPNDLGAAKLTDIKGCETSWGEFQFGVDPWGHVWGCNCGYDSGCIWTEWSPYMDASTKEACNRTLEFYGPKEE